MGTQRAEDDKASAGCTGEETRQHGKAAGDDASDSYARGQAVLCFELQKTERR